MNDTPDIKAILADLAAGRTLSERQARCAFEHIMAGRAADAQIGALLAALAVHPNPAGGVGPTVEEITGAARAMRQHAMMIDVPPGLDVIDTCGTGGDGAGTFNISTAAALIAAAAGAAVAKHGNRSVTSGSGSSQVLEALGVRLGVAPPVLSRCLAEARICFCFAPAHHPAMKHAIGPRQQLGFRTIFNLLGPLTNPAGARRQLIGVYDPALTEPIARVLANLGASHIMVVHGRSPAGGLDEVATTGPTRITIARAGELTTTEVTPEDLGLPLADIDRLRVAGVEQSAAVIRSILAGEKGPPRDIAALNAAAALLIADLAADWREALARSFDAIDSGRARQTLDRLAAITQQGGG